MNTPKALEPPAIVARVNKKKLYMMVGLAAVAYAVLFLFVSGFELVVFGAVVVIAVCYAVRELLTNKTRVVVDGSGVLDTRLGMGTIRWRDIADVYVAQNHDIDHICLEVLEEKKYLNRRSAAAKVALKFNAAANKMSLFAINTGVLDVSSGELFEAIVGWLEYQTREPFPEAVRATELETVM